MWEDSPFWLQQYLFHETTLFAAARGRASPYKRITSVVYLIFVNVLSLELRFLSFQWLIEQIFLVSPNREHYVSTVNFIDFVPRF